MSVRRIALEAFINITDKGAYTNIALKKALAGINERDAKWVSALVEGAQENLYYIDYVLSHYIKGRQKPQIKAILRLGAQELIFMRTPREASCNEAVLLTKEIGKQALSGYVNAVMRNISRNIDNLPALPEDFVKRLSIQHSWPEWVITKWIEAYGETEALQLLQYKHHGMSIRAQYPFSSKELEDSLDSEVIKYTAGKYDGNCIKLERGFNLENSRLFKEGKITVQSEAAMLCCRACGIKNGMNVLDACAAPGGKSAYIYSLLNGGVNVAAWELHAHRKTLIDNTFKRLNVKAQVCCRDAGIYDKQYDSAFDVVLLDVPCSGLGVASSKADIRLNKTEGDIKSLVNIQQKLLETCSRYVKPGGALIYTSCTINHDENEGQIQRFLSGHSEFSESDLSMCLNRDIKGLNGGMVQLLPHIHGIEGFFIARLIKVGT